jgi:hypothetical protein
MAISVYRDNPETYRSTGHDWVRWLDVRLPMTIEEAALALDLIATKIAGLESQLLSVPARAHAVEYAMQKWGERRAEIEWSMERLRAGEPVASIELAKERAAHAETMRRFDEARTQITAMRRVFMAEKGGSMAAPEREIVRGLRVALAAMKTAVEKRDVTISLLKSEKPAAPVLAVDAAAVKRAYVARQHELAASALECIDDVVANGGAHTLVSAMIHASITDSLAAGYRDKWRIIHRPRIDAAAELTAAEAQ